MEVSALSHHSQKVGVQILYEYRVQDIHYEKNVEKVDVSDSTYLLKR